MKWDKIIRDAWRALFRHRLRSFLSSLGIVFAVVAVVATEAVLPPEGGFGTGFYLTLAGMLVATVGIWITVSREN